ncbi:MAG: non-hydrolyzing UDP-N-acetylglucosamine 2-epimerase [Opitutales bacterium]|jgi:UDP-N-acetylglucosamine 2-epimerase (non-hydrolysing)
MRTVALVLGTRPEAVKLAPVHAALAASGRLRPTLVSTGQHREMLAPALAAFGLRAETDLGLMRPGQSLAELAARVTAGVGAWIDSARPDAVLVQGDTTTVLGAAVACAHRRVPFGHVEAGLRTGDMGSPWPEEMNRRVTSVLARWHFCPTADAADNLRREGVPADRIHVTGNTVVDALLASLSRARALAAGDVMARLGVPAGFARRFPQDPSARWALVTGHRRESFGEGFERICRGLLALVESRPDLGLLYPVHLNPAVQEPVRRLLGGHPRIALVPPADYLDFVWLMDRCAFVLTDSGGVQEEAPSLGKPVLVMRDVTERPEGVRAGTSVLVGTDPARIVSESGRLLDDPAELARRSRLPNPFGDGAAAARIVKVLEAAL